MLTFAEPAFLLLLPAVPLVLRWWLGRRREALRYPGVASLTGLPPGRSPVARWGGILLRGAALACLVVALAGPRWPDLRTRIATEGIAIVMVVDVSGSMAERDFDWEGARVPRLEAVKRAFRLFVAGGEGPGGEQLEGRPQDLVGLVTFATRPDCPCPLTLSHSALLRLLDAEQPRHVPGESETNVSDALVLGLHRLRGAGPRRKVLVLLSDGEHNVPQPQSGWTPRQAAQVAANLDVAVHAIDTGGEGGSLAEPGAAPATAADLAQSRSEGVRTLQEVSRITRGRYFTARDTHALLQACQDIDRLEREEIESFQYRRYYEGFTWFGLASLVFWVTVFLLEHTVWLRVP